MDQEKGFHPTSDPAVKHDAPIGVDINGDGKAFRVEEIDPYLPRVTFVEIGRNAGSSSGGYDEQR